MKNGKPVIFIFTVLYKLLNTSKYDIRTFLLRNNNKNFCLVYTLSTPWDGYHRRPFIQNIAKEIVALNGYVLAIEPTIVSIHTLIKYPSRLFNWLRGKYIFRKVGGNIFVYSPYTIEHILLSCRFGILRRINRSILGRSLRNHIRRINERIEDIVLVIHRPELSFLQDAIKFRGLIYDCWDDFCLTSNMKNLKVRGNMKREKEIAEKCNYIISTSEKLFLRNKLNNVNTYLIENGFTESVFKTHLSDNEYSVHKSYLENLKRPIIGYTGNVKHWVDFQLIQYLVSRNPDWTFLFVGPIWTEYGKKYSSFFKKYPNLQVTGYIDYKYFPIYLKYFDVGIVPFIQNEFMESVNPNKFYEYVGAGIPIVSTDIGDLKKKYREIVRIASTPEEFQYHVECILNLSYIERNKLKNRILEVAYKNTWEIKSKYFVELLKKHILQVQN
jgi:hypothetical protein